MKLNQLFRIRTAALAMSLITLLSGCSAPASPGGAQEPPAGDQVTAVEPEEEIPEAPEEESPETVIIHYEGQDIEVELAPPQSYDFSTSDPARRVNWDDVLADYPDIQFWMLAPMAGVDSPVVLSSTPAERSLHTGEEFNAEPAPVIQKVTDYDGQNLLDGFRNYADIEFFRENPAIYLYRPKYSYEYLVFAAFHNEDDIDPFTAALEDYDGFNNYIDRLYGKSEIGFNLNPDLKEKVQIEHRFLAVELPSSSGSFLVLAVINGMVPVEGAQ
ncbi:MAG: hypothetical protein II759_00200 [Lachnospiraceae bacterium]|nr:hypothetical protein [Lachnospiraceae bacterium]